MAKVRPLPLEEQNKTDLEKFKLTGPVKQFMQTRYKAHYDAGKVLQGKIEEDSYPYKNILVQFNDKGRKISETHYSPGHYETNTYNEEGKNTESNSVYAGHAASNRNTKVMYDEKGFLTEVVSTCGEEKNNSCSTYKNDAAGRCIESISYRGVEKEMTERTTWQYHETGELISCISYNPDGSIKHQTVNTLDSRGLKLESATTYMDEQMAPHGHRYTYRYNDQDDVIEMAMYKADGRLDKLHHWSYEYDSDGYRIVDPADRYDPDAKAPGETEELENDAHGNWIKKTIFIKNIPKNILIREINYFGEEEKNLVHPLTTQKPEEVKHTPMPMEELEDGEAKWLTDLPGLSPENFPITRYYALRFNEYPSVINYAGPYIEVMALLEKLKEGMSAQIIHSQSGVWNGGAVHLNNYTLLFPFDSGYILHAPHIASHEADEFEVPDYLGLDVDRYVYFSQLQLLCPSEASGKRDEFFEERINDYVNECMMEKMPDKPVINMIEVGGNGFTMVEHAVDDNFEIRDLDVNYGSGFAKFHSDLMQRFNSSTKGLVLFHGQPGTGKTYYIRHLLRKMVANKKVVIYMPPNMVDHLVEPGFMTFLSGEIRDWSAEGNFCVLLIEDAEPLLAKRQEGVRIQGITNLLNMSDGLLNDMLNLQIICTFNVDLRKLDSALLRPGRLIARKEFKALGELDANLLAQRLGIKHHFNKPATLGEIYAMRKNQNTLIHDVEQDRGASTQIDDLI